MTKKKPNALDAGVAAQRDQIKQALDAVFEGVNSSGRGILANLDATYDALAPHIEIQQVGNHSLATPNDALRAAYEDYGQRYRQGDNPFNGAIKRGFKHSVLKSSASNYAKVLAACFEHDPPMRPSDACEKYGSMQRIISLWEENGGGYKRGRLAKEREADKRRAKEAQERTEADDGRGDAERSNVEERGETLSALLDELNKAKRQAEEFKTQAEEFKTKWRAAEQRAQSAEAKLAALERERAQADGPSVAIARPAETMPRGADAPLEVHSDEAAELPQPESQPELVAKKRRGRPPGSKTKKTTEKELKQASKSGEMCGYEIAAYDAMAGTRKDYRFSGPQAPFDLSALSATAISAWYESFRKAYALQYPVVIAEIERGQHRRHRRRARLLPEERTRRDHYPRVPRHHGLQRLFQDRR